MSDPILLESDFLRRVVAVVERNMSNEQFGVSELADQMHMSRSNLLRKIKRETKLSASQLINQLRLKRAMELLRKSSLNVSEIAHEVGFNSPSYFIKCFREHYGYPPGEAGKRNSEAASPVATEIPSSPGRQKFIVFGGIAVLAALLTTAVVYILSGKGSEADPVEKSIVVLPFKNESSDSTNVYLINGIMEATLTNLQRLQDLKVISRTSAEKYRDSKKTIPEMARELKANYFVEGSGQKIGDNILLNIQLIEAASDRHIWAKQYRRKVEDIFELQTEISKTIAAEIKAVITPAEKRRIEYKPTANLEAYDLFLKGQDLLRQGGDQNLEGAIAFFKQAIEKDPEFAMAYAEAVLAYYYLDIFQKDQKYDDEIASFADKAVLYDPKLDGSLVAKAISYIQKKEYEQAAPYLEKALEYNPNSILVLRFLADFYYMYLPNTAKYLEYALKGMRLDLLSKDSVNRSYTYIHLSNALLQTGFIDESLSAIDKAKALFPENPYADYIRIFIVLAKNQNLPKARALLVEKYEQDTTRIDILQEVGKICYLMEDYDRAYHYYKKFIALRESRGLDIYVQEDLKIGIVLERAGEHQQARKYFESFKKYADADKSIYKHLNLAIYYAYMKDRDKVAGHLRQFAEEEDYLIWVLFWELDPPTHHYDDDAEIRAIMTGIEKKFWHNHQVLRDKLEGEGLL